MKGKTMKEYKVVKVIYPDNCVGFFETKEEAEKEVRENAKFWDYNIADYEIKEIAIDKKLF